LRRRGVAVEGKAQNGCMVRLQRFQKFHWSTAETELLDGRNRNRNIGMVGFGWKFNWNETHQTFDFLVDSMACGNWSHLLFHCSENHVLSLLLLHKHISNFLKIRMLL